MGNDKTGLLVLGALAAFLLLGQKKVGPGPGPGPGGPVNVSGSVGSIQANSSGGLLFGQPRVTTAVWKLPGQTAQFSAGYTVSAKKPNGQGLEWAYKLGYQLRRGNSVLLTDVMAPFTRNPGSYSDGWGIEIPVSVSAGDILDVLFVLYGANSDAQGNPLTTFKSLDQKTFTGVFAIGGNEITGSVNSITAAQDGRVPSRSRGPFYAPPPYTRPPGGGRPPIRPQQGVFRDPQEGLVSSGKANPWLYRERAAI